MTMRLKIQSRQYSVGGEDDTMTSIQSDSEFRAALSELSLAQQRQVGKRFIDHVIELSDNPRVTKAVTFVAASGLPAAAEIADGYKAAKAAAIDSYTLCGHEGDWRRQASHFVAAAAAACLTPEPQAGPAGSIAWSTAMNARMARVCARIAEGVGADDTEATKQYDILEAFLDAG